MRGVQHLALGWSEWRGNASFGPRIGRVEGGCIIEMSCDVTATWNVQKIQAKASYGPQVAVSGLKYRICLPSEWYFNRCCSACVLSQWWS